MEIKKKFILTIVLLSYLATAINGAIVITGLENMAKDLDLNQSVLSWVQNSYVLAWGCFMLLGGRLSDAFGRRVILNLSLLLFGIGSLFAGIATSATILILSRFIQGVGASILAPTSLALIMDYFTGEERVKAIAWYSSISGLGMCIGLVMGGTLASFFSWRYGFFIYLPLIVFMLIVSMKMLNKNNKKHSKGYFDIYGTIASVIGIFSFVYAINGASNIWLWLIVSCISLFLFMRIESKATAPIMPLRLFNKPRTCANIARILFAGAMMGFYFFVSEYLQEVFMFSPLWVGIAFFPLTLFTFWGAIEVPRAVRHWGDKRTLFGGFVLMLTGFIGMLYLNTTSGYWLGIGIPMILIGFGQGLVMSPLTNLGIQEVRPEDSGAASGVVNAAHQIGCSVGLSVMVACTTHTADMVAICHTAMLIGFIFTLLSFITIFSSNYKSNN